MSPKKNEGGFSDEEKAAMKERAAELRAAAKRGAKGDGEPDVLAKIDEMQEPDKSTALRLHTLIRQTLPQLAPRTWYGMPAYAKDGKVVCFFQSGIKFGTRYCTLGFQDPAALDDGDMWPTAYAISLLTPEVEQRAISLIKKAAGAQ